MGNVIEKISQRTKSILALKEKMLAYAFKGRRHDVGDKLGFLQATVEFALQREELKDDFIAYLEQIVAVERAK